eukprot:366363-Chlamydomonas_euryale.AAC.1
MHVCRLVARERQLVDSQRKLSGELNEARGALQEARSTCLAMAAQAEGAHQRKQKLEAALESLQKCVMRCEGEWGQ